jgi:hypothetical protein
MKWFVRIAVALMLLVVALVVAARLYIESFVIEAAEAAGPSVLGVPIQIEQAKFRLLRGHMTLRAFVLGNPKGFKTKHAISVGEITVDLDIRTLLSDTIVIKRVYVDTPDIAYELRLGKSNLGRILEQASGPAEGTPEPEMKAEPAAEETGGRKVVIEDLLIERGRVHIAAMVTMGASAPIPLPTIHLTNIGKEQQGESPSGVIRQVLGAIAGTVTKVVTGTVGLVGDGAKAAGRGTSKVVGGVTGMFKSDRPTNEPPAEKPAPQEPGTE